MTAVVNLYKGACSEFSALEIDLLSVAEKLSESHPFVERFARHCNRGRHRIIVHTSAVLALVSHA